MRKGFWEDNDAIRQEFIDDGDEKDYGNFMWLENEDWGGELTDPDCRINLYTFLHGDCNVFADVLYKKFGYKTESITDDEGNLVHAYGISHIDGKLHFIDIRGITDNWDEFIEEFDDFIPCHDRSELFIQLSNGYHSKYKDEDFLKRITNFANRVVDEISDYYKI